MKHERLGVAICAETDYDSSMDRGGFIRKTCKRYNTPWDPHAMSFSCYHQQPFLGKDRTRKYVATAVTQARRKHGFDLWAYVVMPDHVHLLIFPSTQTYSISKILQCVKQSVARKAVGYLRKHDPDGLVCLATGQKHSPYRFWQDGGGYDRNVRSRQELLNTLDYIHMNPVKRGLVRRPEEWIWSSYRDWEGLGEGPIPIDRESFLRSAM